MRRATPVDVAVLTSWFTQLGWSIRKKDETTLRVTPPSLDVPPFYVRLAENWLLLAMMPVVPRDAPRPRDLSRRMLAVNRDMRLAKLAYDEDGDVILAAELPTESLDFSEVRDAAERMARYALHYREYLTKARG